MKIFLIVIAIVFVILFVFYIFVSIRMNSLLKDKKEDYLAKLSAHDQDVIKGYLESSKVEFKEIFRRKK